MLQKYLPGPSCVIRPQEVQLDKVLSYQEEPISIMDKQVKKLRSKEIPVVKVVWSNHSQEEATWEAENERLKNYPQLFAS